VGLAGTDVGAAVVVAGGTDGSDVGCKGTDVGTGATVAVEDTSGSTRQPTTSAREITQSDAATWPTNLSDRKDPTPQIDTQMQINLVNSPYDTPSLPGCQNTDQGYLLNK
jgi:hypothetical protein